MTSSDAMDAADLQASAASAPAFLKRTRYPASKDRLLRRAVDAGAPEGVVRVLKLLPDREYLSSVDLLKEIDNATLMGAYKKNITGGLGTRGTA